MKQLHFFASSLPRQLYIVAINRRSGSQLLLTLEGELSTAQRAAATQKCLSATGAPPAPSGTAACAGAQGWGTQQSQFAQHTHNGLCVLPTEKLPQQRSTGQNRGQNSPWRSWCLLGQFGEIRTGRQNLGHDPCQGQCLGCEGQAAAPTGAGSTRCRAALTAALCSPISNVTPGAVPGWPCQCQPHLFPMCWEEITDSKPLSYLKITGRCHRRVNASHSENKILSLELKNGIMQRTEF